MSSDSAATLGIGACGTAAQTQTVTGVAARTLTFVVYACAEGSGTVTAAVRQSGSTTSLATVSQRLLVEAVPELAPGTGSGSTARAAGSTSRSVARAGTPGLVPSIIFPFRAHNSVRVAWGTPSDGDEALTGFGLLLWRTQDTQPAYSSALVKGAGDRGHTYTGLQADTLYKFRIHACNGADSCGWWTEPPKEVRTLTPPPEPTPTPTATAAPVGRPDRPHTLSFDEIKATSARANWRIAANTGGVALTGFGLLRWPTGTAEPPHSQAIVVGDGSATQKAMTGLTPATTYLFKMRACNGPNRCSDWTANHTFTTLAGTVTPGRVTNLRHSSSGDNSVTLAWSAPGNSAAAALTGYHVQNRPLESDWPGDGVDVVQGAGTTTFTVSQLVDGTIYEFQVQACNAAGCGAWTDLLHPDHVIVAGHKVGNASLIPASASLAVGARLGVGIHDIPKGKVAYAQMYGAIQPAGQCSTTRGTRDVARAPSASTGSGYYDTVNIEGCAPGGIGWLRVVNAAETELYARATIRVGVPPGKVGPLTVTPGNASLDVAWVAPSAGDRPITHYDLQYRAGTSGDWTLVEDITLTSYTITGLTNGTSYQVQVRAVSEVGGGAWSDSATGVPSDVEQTVTSPPGTTPAAIDPECPATSADTVPLSQLRVDIVPQPQRKASVCWPSVQNATAYVIEASENTGDIQNTSASDWQRLPGTAEQADVSGKVQRVQLNLDHIMTTSGEMRGLAHAAAYGIRIGVKYANATILYGPPVIIIDTPITKANGNSKDVSGGQAKITWTPLRDILNSNYGNGVHLLRRRASASVDNNVRFHGSRRWTLDAFDLPPTPDFQATSNPATIGSLDRYRVYAVQLIYRDYRFNASDADVFAARNVYVWPSNRPPDPGERVASFPLSNRITNKTFSYRVCAESFNVEGWPRKGEWLQLISRAFEHWQAAVTTDLIRIQRSDPSVDPCADYTEVIKQVTAEVERLARTETAAEVLSKTRDFIATLQILMDVSKEDVKGNDIILYNNLYDANEETLRVEGVFPEIANDVGHARDCWFVKDKNGAWMYDTSTLMCTVPLDPPSDTDIFIQRKAFMSQSLVVPAANARFNMCLNSGDKNDVAYASFIHEVGHVLGIGGGSKYDSISKSDWISTGHPEVPDSIVNYDWQAVRLKGPANPPPQGEFAAFEEPNCGPYPLDVMALYALYQTK